MSSLARFGRLPPPDSTNEGRGSLDSRIMNRLRNRLLPLSIPALVLATVLAGSPAGAATSGPVGAYPAWTITPEDTEAQNHSGTIDFDVLGMPDATYTVTKTSADGEDTQLLTSDDAGDWFTADTPFGAVFGASGPSTSIQLLKTRVDETTATTTVTFATPVPANVLGFAVADIDVDQLVISGTTADGTAVTGDQLAGTTFNFCDVAEPKPDNCDGVDAPYAVPTWTPATGTVSYPADEDSDGASASFRPTVAISSLTFAFRSVSAGAPSYRLWFAALSSSVNGTVAFPAGSAKVPVTVNLLGTDGSTLATTTTDESGNYSFPSVVASPGLRIELVAPAGFSVDGSTTAEVDLEAGSVAVPFTLVLGAPQVVPAYTG